MEPVLAEHHQVPVTKDKSENHPVENVILQDTESTISTNNISRVLLKLLLHSILMFSLPFFAYYGIKNYAEKEYDVHSPKSYTCGLIGAVVVVHLIIASYVYQAFQEDESSKKILKKIS